MGETICTLPIFQLNMRREFDQLAEKALYGRIAPLSDVESLRSLVPSQPYESLDCSEVDPV